MRRCAAWLLTPVVVLLLGLASTSADDALLNRLVEEHSYNLKADDEKIGGSGLTFLLKATEDAQFFCFAEHTTSNRFP